MKATKTKSFNDSVFEWVNKNLVPPFVKISENFFVKSVYEGFASIIGVLMIGSIFILLFGLATNYKLFSFLLPIAMPLLGGYQLTMGLTGLFVSASLSYSLAKNSKLDPHGGMLVGLATFIMLAVTVKDGAIAINNLGSQGIFTAMISSIITISIYRFCVKNNITIKMPEGVPPAIANMFTALIPAAISMLLAWLVRQISNVDLVVLVQNLLTPIFAAVDNILTFTFRYFLGQLIWSTGIHADAIISGITSAFMTTNITENAAAFAAGTPANQLPHVWVSSLERLVGWTTSVWGLVYWMLRSKAKNLRTLAITTLPSTFFTIIEPILFGLPIVFNPFLLIPFVLSATVGAFVSYGALSLHLVNRYFVDLPWITPPPFSAFLGTGGDWRALILLVVNVIIGILIYAPFFKAFEKFEMEKETGNK